MFVLRGLRPKLVFLALFFLVFFFISNPCAFADEISTNPNFNQIYSDVEYSSTDNLAENAYSNSNSSTEGNEAESMDDGSHDDMDLRDNSLHNTEQAEVKIISDNNGIRCLLPSGNYAYNKWLSLDSKSYYFGEDGYALRYEQWIDGKFYYFNGSDCSMHTGWLTWLSDGTRSYFDPETGAMSFGVHVIDGLKYDFGTDGKINI